MKLTHWRARSTTEVSRAQIEFVRDAGQRRLSYVRDEAVWRGIATVSTTSSMSDSVIIRSTDCCLRMVTGAMSAVGGDRAGAEFAAVPGFSDDVVEHSRGRCAGRFGPLVGWIPAMLLHHKFDKEGLHPSYTRYVANGQMALAIDGETTERRSQLIYEYLVPAAELSEGN